MGDTRQLYDTMSSSYDSDRVHSYFNYVRRFIIDWVGGSPKTIIEVGSGTGEYCLALSSLGHTVLGLDLSPEMVRKAQEKSSARGLNDCSFEVADAENTFPSLDSVDRILAIDCWECFADPVALLRNAKNALSPGGKMLIITPNNWLFPLFWLAETIRIKKNRPAFDHHNSYPHRIASFARKVGFSVESCRPVFHLTTLAVVLTADDIRR